MYQIRITDKKTNVIISIKNCSFYKETVSKNETNIITDNGFLSIDNRKYEYTIKEI